MTRESEGQPASRPVREIEQAIDWLEAWGPDPLPTKVASVAGALRNIGADWLRLDRLEFDHRQRIAELETERDRALADASRLGDALFDLVETKDENARLREELKRSREIHPDLEGLLAELFDIRAELAEDKARRGQTQTLRHAMGAIEELGKRNAELSLRDDERATGWFVVDPEEGLCGVYESEEVARAALKAMIEPGDELGSDMYVAEVNYVGPLRKRIAELEEERKAIAWGARSNAERLKTWADAVVGTRTSEVTS